MSEQTGIAAGWPEQYPAEADAAAARAAAAVPGLASLLWLDEVDPAQRSRRGLLDALVALERTKAWAEARLSACSPR